ncbi:sensor histidine kinase [Sporomusa carbonis]|uniref:sensor histidine kinase n=1 Tax=Sporomusa carbonis TaxID=3076075 RepID=UPI003C7B82A4
MTALIGIALVAIIAGVIINYLNYQYRMVMAAERERLSVAANNLDMYFNARLTGLKLLAADQDIRSLEPKRARKKLLLAADVLDFANVALYDPSGALITDLWTVPGYTQPPFKVHDIEDSFKTALSGRPVVSDRIVCEKIENAYISILLPVLDDSGNVAAVLLACEPISNIAMIVLREHMPENQYFFVMDSSAQIIYHPRLAQFYPEGSLFKDGIGGLLNGKSGIVSFKSFLDGMDKLLIYTDLYYTNWRMVMAIPIKTVYARVLSKSIDEAASFFFVTICFALLYGVWWQGKRHEREREQLRLERMACVNQLAAGIAHEIRNPLTSIQGFIQLMARRADKPPRREHLEIIITEIGRIDKLISEFQMLARPLKEPVFEKVNICKLLNDIAVLMEGQLHSKSVALTLQLPEVGCYTYGDIAQLKQVFINLLKNAVEAVPHGGNITMAVGKYQGMMVVRVEDNGNGIPPEIIDKLGTPFFTTKETGTGLGLSVCYNIIQNHNGQIKVSSQIGKGSVFTVLLPLAEDECCMLPVNNEQQGFCV